eukprot:CAMPEP_0197290216 /NCGR_PEP_ID=MMETSP0890-20130614/7448_1 /TAXON_ID=44058 ORGANISM="Aureoumbra lagunensis, Strain CCMP1510" /NCGR_SAMPLE_ID=MMETSP0890 /ASSEMBLY_ACC=CAM_ASM_000533 /LENGTH=512 /DNA_ID=CAMNT_0042762093 /DNA_START=237 /DNA_END=1775 /DNA_ORIENTATION=+
MEDIVSLCRRRGFVFGSSEIYNGFNGFYDYGPLGVELKKNIKDRWWRDMVQCRDDIFGLDSSIISSPLVWEASGHVGSFSDPMVIDKKSGKRFRADQLVCALAKKENGEDLGMLTMLESDDCISDLSALAKKYFKDKTCVIDESTLIYVSELDGGDIMQSIPSPDDQSRIGDLTPPKPFNLMFETKVGAMDDSSAIAYLRPETAQGIFTNFKNIASTARGFKLPCGIAQIGKAFRNEITPRNFIFRSREFEQMEIEYFISPEDWEEYYQTWINTCFDWLISVCGLRKDLLHFEVHDKLAHYAQACTDITFDFPFGNQELQGIAARGSYDLTCHQSKSGKSLEYRDEQQNIRFIPSVIEPSIGVDRLFLAVLCSAYSTDQVDGETRVALKLHPNLAPVKCAVLPLIKNKPELTELALSLHKKIQQRYHCQYDATGAVGRRYRRQDEIGTPFCITVDFQTLEDQTVTIRDRDSMLQIRIDLDQVTSFLDNIIMDGSSFESWCQHNSPDEVVAKE